VARSSLGAGLDGILVVDKPVGPTSHDVVALVRRLAATRRVGHGGTLDPFATGVLPVFLGQATRVVEYHLGDDKSYRATVCFGATSTTDDLEGELTLAAGPAPDQAAVEAVLARSTGRILQRPPAFSAVKVAGRRAYAMARAGVVPELAPRAVSIHAARLVSWDGSDPDRPIAIVDVDCSAGTYIRAFARDLGETLGNAAYLGALSRTASGPFRVADAIPLEAIRAAAAADGPAGILARLRPIDDGLEAFPLVTLGPDEVGAISRGQAIRWASEGNAPDPAIEAPHYRLVDPSGALVAIATLRDGRLAPDKVLVGAARRSSESVEAASAAPVEPATTRA